MRTTIFGIALLGSACEPALPEPAAPGALEQGPEGPLLGLGGAYHGLLLDADDQPLVLEAEGALELQRELLGLVLATATEQDLAAGAQAQGLLSDKPRPRDEELVDNDLVLDFLMREDTLEAQYGQAQGLLHVAVTGVVDVDPHAAVGIVTCNGFLPNPAEEALAYLDQCASDGVPLPPAWPSGWSAQGELVPSYGDFSQQLWAWPDKASPLCVAAHGAPGGRASLQILCRDPDSGASCLWERGSPQPLPEPVKLEQMEHGERISYDCADCHP
jgi:hypothetical protein